jgi:glycosyltransferase involved in cell wall biosynthesis
VSRACLDAVGPLDESFFLYSEETDFMLRARDAGHPVRPVAGAEVVHLGGELGTDPDLWALRTVNRVHLQRRRTGRWSTSGFLAASIAGESLRAAAGRSTSRRAVGRLLREGPRIVLEPARRPAPSPPGWVCFSAQDFWYHNRAHSDIQLMSRIADDRPVLLVNSIGLRVPVPGRSTEPLRRIRRKAASVARLVRRPDPDRPELRVMTPLPIPVYRWPWARDLNARLVAAQVTLAARLTGVVGDGADPVVMVTIPTAIDAARRVPHQALVVNRSDKHSAFPEADEATVAERERACLAAADVVVASSHALVDDEREHTTAPVHFLDHGVDAEHFRRRPADAVPPDLAAIPGPRIGFFGSLDDYLVDFALLEELARAMPDASLVLVGDATCPLDGLAGLPNVHLLGHRPYASIPAYGSAFDVALMPWLTNRWIHYANPIKLKEYLALGLAVVSTDFPEAHHYGHLLRIAGDHASFVQAVADTLDDGGPATPAQRRAAVVTSTWDRAAALLRDEGERAATRRRLEGSRR